MKESGQSHVREQIFPPVVGAGPGRIPQEHLAPQFAGDAQALLWAEATDAVTPVGVFGLARRGPVARHECPDAPSDHVSIVAGAPSISRDKADLQKRSPFEAKYAHLRPLCQRPHDQIQMPGIGGLGQVGNRRLGLRMRMRVVEADHLEAAISRGAPRVYMGFWIQLIPVGIVRQVAGADGLDDFVGATDQDAAALGRQRVVRMGGDLIEHVARDPDGYNASTAIAMPMPPPMHNAATPYRSLLARSA